MRIPSPTGVLKAHPSFVLMTPALVLFLCVFTLPILLLIGISVQESVPLKRYEAGLTFDSYWRFLTDTFYLLQLGRTFRIAIISTALCVVLGYPVAYMIWRARGTRKALLLSIVLLPLFTNIIARIYAWLVVLAKNGPINWVMVNAQVIDEPVLLNGSLATVIMGVTYVALPYFVLILYSGLEGIDWSLVEAARTLGARRARSTAEVVIPLSAPSLAGAMAVAMSWGMGAFAEPRILGSPREWTTGLEAGTQIVRNLDWPFGAVLAIVTAVSTLTCIIIIFRVVARKKMMA